MAIPANNGTINFLTQEITPNSTGTWGDLDGTAWADWRSWSYSPVATHYYTSPNQITLPSAQWVNIIINSDAVGTKSYQIHSSLTGTFTGEETTTTVSAGDENITAFYGRYFKVTIAVDYDPGAGLNVIRSIDFTAQNDTFEITLVNINTEDLNGIVSARELELPRTVSYIQTMIITPYVPDPYFADTYVADDYIQTSAPAYPAIYSKDPSNPRLAFVSDSGEYRESRFDCVLRVYPEQYMDELGNLALR